MRYVGGKSKIAKGITDAILSDTPRRGAYLEPFVGGGAAFARLAPHFEESTGSDAHEDLILMWNEALVGWVPPALTYEQYQELRYSTEPGALRGFAGFGCSFGGRWFEGFARGGKQASGEPRNHQGESSRAVRRIADGILGLDAKFIYQDYRELADVDVSSMVIYCDPPYAGSSKDYKVGRFDSVAFWAQAQGWAEAGAHVYVSEYAAPVGWECIWEQTHRQSLARPDQGRGLTTERLFTFRAAISHYAHEYEVKSAA